MFYKASAGSALSVGTWRSHNATPGAGAVAAGQRWKAAVEETVSATLNRTVSSGISGASYYTGSFASMARSPYGDYVGVTSRGNFYMTWQPGQVRPS